MQARACVVSALHLHLSCLRAIGGNERRVRGANGARTIEAHGAVGELIWHHLQRHGVRVAVRCVQRGEVVHAGSVPKNSHACTAIARKHGGACNGERDQMHATAKADLWISVPCIVTESNQLEVGVDGVRGRRGEEKGEHGATWGETMAEVCGLAELSEGSCTKK